MNRSSFLIAALLLAMSFSQSCTNVGTTGKGQQPAKYIFLFIGDGMGQTHVAATESYLSFKEGKLGGERLTFTQFPYTGAINTFSADRNVTCSSAAGTALSTGSKTRNGRLGIGPDGDTLKSITFSLKDKGYRIGIMSTVPVNHATPAAFYANSTSRKEYYEIGRQIPDSGFEYFAGDGFLEFNGKDGDKEPLDSYLEDNGYSVCFGRDEYEKMKDSPKIVLCQPDNKGGNSSNYVVEAEAEENFSLAEMLETALDRFGDKEPFFVMCEGGTIDWAAHSNRTMAMVEDIIEMDDAVSVAYEFYKAHPEETLIVVTADHETGGITLNDRSNHSSMLEWDVLEDSWAASGRKDILNDDENMQLNTRAHIGWSTSEHTGGPVPVFAIGKGAEKFTGWYDNTDIPKKIVCKE